MFVIAPINDNKNKEVLVLRSLAVGHPSKDKLKKIINKYMKDEIYLYGAYYNNALSGIIGISVKDNIGIIHHIAVKPDYRRLKIASK
jgi:hypothetical protein